MAEIKEKVSAEMENIETIIVELKKVSALSNVSSIELAGIGAFLHNFYNAVENILKQILSSMNIAIPAGSFWHRDLLDTAYASKLISLKVKEELGPYLAFRHFFVHGYSLDLRADLLSPLVKSISSTYENFKKDLQSQGLV